MKIGINGFGRIGRIVFRILEKIDDLEVVAINDLTDAEQLAYLLKYDTNHRRYNEEVSFDNENNIIVNGKKVKVFACQNPSDIPWGEMGVDLVFECTGRFTNCDDAYKHIEAGCKKVIISAPAKGDLKTIVYNVNHDILTGDEEVISAASCTTNCLAPVLNVINNEFGIEAGFMTTVHAYTNDQATLDIAHKKGINARRGRAAAANIVPASTGAASAIGEVIPALKGKLDGSAMRVPVSDGSVIDLTLELSKKVDVDMINKCFVDNFNETLQITMDPIVSSDILGRGEGALVDGLSTKVLNVGDKQLVKIVAWYDNEYGYSMQMVRTALYLLNK